MKVLSELTLLGVINILVVHLVKSRQTGSAVGWSGQPMLSSALSVDGPETTHRV